MTLKWKLSFRLAAAMIPIMAVWAGLFYHIMAGEIRDEVDDSLQRYARVVVPAFLKGEDSGDIENGYNNVYTIHPVSEEYAMGRKYISFVDTTVCMGAAGDSEPARKMSLIFRDEEGGLHVLEAMTPTFERDDLMETVLKWVILLYLILTALIIIGSSLIVQTGLKPLYRILDWLKAYKPGQTRSPVPGNCGNNEFSMVSKALQEASDRSESLLEQQKDFIGNAAHELQTPLAVIGNSLEFMMNDPTITETQMERILDMIAIQRKASRLTRTLLTIAKVESGQSLENGTPDIGAAVREQTGLMSEIYAYKGFDIVTETASSLIVRMNDPLSGLLISNLVKNAFSYTPDGGRIHISIKGTRLFVRNQGTEELDGSAIFARFRHSGSKDSNGLGLALVKSVCERYNLPLEYRFEDGMHTFSVDFSKISV